MLGSATALNILFGLPIWIGVLVTIGDSLLFLFIHYFGVRKLEAFFAFLIFIMAVTFWINMVAAGPDVPALLFGTLVPTIPQGSLEAAIAIFGAVIMPHNLYLHSALVLSRKVDLRNRNHVKEATIYNSIESAISLTLSFFITLAVLATFAVYIEKNPSADKDLDLR